MTMDLITSKQTNKQTNKIHKLRHIQQEMWIRMAGRLVPKVWWIISRNKPEKTSLEPDQTWKSTKYWNTI